VGDGVVGRRPAPGRIADHDYLLELELIERPVEGREVELHRAVEVLAPLGLAVARGIEHDHVIAPLEVLELVPPVLQVAAPAVHEHDGLGLIRRRPGPR
jgi:hypothetical protein